MFKILGSYLITLFIIGMICGFIAMLDEPAMATLVGLVLFWISLLVFGLILVNRKS